MLIHWYRIANWVYRHRVPVLPKLIYYIQYFLFNSSVPASCTLQNGVKFAYGGIATVIHARAVVGKIVLLDNVLRLVGVANITRCLALAIMCI